MPSLSIPIETPCGTKTIKIPLPLALPPLPSIPPDGFPPTFPPAFPLPMPDCSILEHTGSAPEDPADSEP
jgi:hypothetical protein